MDAVTIDFGAYQTKVGFWGDENPKEVFPTIVGHPGGPANLPLFGYGIYAESARRVKHLIPFIKEGLVLQWDHMEYVFPKIFSNEVKVAPEDYSVVMTDHDLNTNANRERTLQIIFEKLSCPSHCFVPQSAAGAARLAPPNKDYLVVFSGYDSSFVIPIIQGRPSYEHLTRIEQTGHDTTLLMVKLMMQNSGYAFTTPHEIEIVQEIKEHCAFVVPDRLPVSLTERSHELPDGQIIAVRDERYLCAEPMFDPSNAKSVQNAVMETVAKVGNKALVSNIILVGGNTCLRGFAQRLTYELNLLEKSQGVNVIGHEGEKFATYVGASLLAPSPAYKYRWVSKEEYDEHGLAILSHKKLF